jgi:hypothetical protein
MHVIVRGKHDHFGKTRSQQELNMRKEWGSTMTDEQLDKVKYVEKQGKKIGSRKNFITGPEIDAVN